MANIIRGVANVGEAPEGELAVYLDAALTQPVNELTEISFGEFPFKDNFGPGMQVASTESVHVWVRCEANVPMVLTGSVDKENISCGRPNGRVLQPGEVIDWEMSAVLKWTEDVPNPFNGETIVFSTSIFGRFQ